MPQLSDPAEYKRIRARWTELPPGYGFIEDPETLEVSIVKLSDHLDFNERADISLIKGRKKINHSR